MSYREYADVGPRLVGYDPFYDLASDHLARLVEYVVEAYVKRRPLAAGPGGPRFDPRLLVKVLIYGYSTGVRSSRMLERLCEENLPYLFLTRGDTPTYRTLCTARLQLAPELEECFLGLFAVASEAGLKRVGRLTVDSSKLRANASPEAVVSAKEYQAVREELQRILDEAAAVDAKEEEQGRPGDTRLGKPVDAEQMRDILRRVRKARRQQQTPAAATLTPGSAPVTQTEPVSATCSPADGLFGPNEGSASEAHKPEQTEPVASKAVDGSKYSCEMLQRIAAGVKSIEAAEKAGLGHVCLTDPDARMMGEGREKRIRECHSFETAVDSELMVVGQSTQEGTDNARLPEIVAAAERYEPGGVKAMTADSGYYRGDTIAELISDGVDMCVPDPHTACDLHRGLPIGTTSLRCFKDANFVYNPETDSYTCEAGHALLFTQERDHGGQHVRVYVAEADCQACTLAAGCLCNPKAKHRTLKVGANAEVLAKDRQRFDEPEHRERYRHRGEAVETVFGFLRGTLGYTRWLLRGSERVACEARLFRLAYQMRKVHSWMRLA